MALPNKKQLNKHKRGTKKALDTLDALDNLESESVDEIVEPPAEADVPAIPEKKKPTQKAMRVEEVKLELTEDEPIEKQEPKKKIDFDTEDEALFSDFVETPAVEEKIAVSNDEHVEEIETIPETIPLDEPKMEMKSPLTINPLTSAETSPDAKSGKVANSGKEADASMVTDDDEFDEDTLKDRYLTFRIDQEDYAIEIKYVTEIIVMQRITEVPETPVFIQGVINLRGMVIPVMDVRHRFNIESREYDDRTCIIVVNFDEVAVGLIVDVVNEVVDIPEKDVDPPPSAHSGIQSGYIKGMGKIGKKVKIIIDVEKVLDRKNVEQLDDF